ncbi:FG-GAP repeat domain-containing protein [Nannocystis radixulma]|uniref:VCBS repeat-containing protein n=1 Tax=Nannocystis radixulma TaxID=2995305 RepID=A0ABT5BBF1_9BACT|nr:VCBS repeat-containing protein [Nannocystis radixulma]MDC0670778.1 VCBS repeat-containing protein [Nannocystis radixulma]
MSILVTSFVVSLAGTAWARADHFAEPTLVSRAFAADDGWRAGRNPRVLADVNGDGCDDLVGFGDHGVVVALSTFSGAPGPALGEPRLWLDAFGHDAGGWRDDRHLRLLADVDGDGLHDVVGFGDDGVVVAVSLGDHLAAPERWSDEFAGDTWHVERHPRVLVDVDGDGTLDIVGFADDGVRVARGSGRDFQPATRAVAAYGDGEWQVELHPRMLADVSGDGLPDIVGFHDAGVFVSLATADGFTPPAQWLDALGTEDGFESQDRFPRVLADVDGDAHADIVAFAGRGVFLARSTGEGFAGPELVLPEFSRDHGGWDSRSTPRLVADVDDDGRADIVGFADPGVFVSLSTGEGFGAPSPWVWSYGRDRGWQVPRHPRLLGDLDDDGQLDVVGVFDDGVWVALARPTRRRLAMAS